MFDMINTMKYDVWPIGSISFGQASCGGAQEVAKYLNMGRSDQLPTQSRRNSKQLVDESM